MRDNENDTTVHEDEIADLRSTLAKQREVMTMKDKEIERLTGLGVEAVPHGIGDKCPTWYDGCHCTVETLVHNMDKHREYKAATQAQAEEIRKLKARNKELYERTKHREDEPRERIQFKEVEQWLEFTHKEWQSRPIEDALQAENDRLKGVMREAARLIGFMTNAKIAEAANMLREELKETPLDKSRQSNTPCVDAIDKLWKDIILRRKPNYGEWEYAGQAYRHLKAEFEEIEDQNNRLRQALSDCADYIDPKKEFKSSALLLAKARELLALK